MEGRHLLPPYIWGNGKSRRIYLIMILDDYSRMIVGGKLYYQENAANFQKTLYEAVPHMEFPINFMLITVPLTVMTNFRSSASRSGRSYSIRRFAMAPVRRSEWNFLTLKARWLYSLDISQIQSLDEFNRLLADYIRRHNTTRHSGTGQTPLERYLASNERIRKPVPREWLEEAFHNQVVRNVNKDAAIHLSNGCYDAPMQFIGQKVEVRFIPGAWRVRTSCTEDGIIVCG